MCLCACVSCLSGPETQNLVNPLLSHGNLWHAVDVTFSRDKNSECCVLLMSLSSQSGGSERGCICCCLTSCRLRSWNWFCCESLSWAFIMAWLALVICRPQKGLDTNRKWSVRLGQTLPVVQHLWECWSLETKSFC